MASEETPVNYVPNLKLTQLRFKASRGNNEAAEELMVHIKEKSMFLFYLGRFIYLFFSLLDMAPFYITLCEQLKWNLDKKLLKEMQDANENRLKELQEILKDAEENLGDNEVREACLARAQFFSEIGNKVLFLF